MDRKTLVWIGIAVGGAVGSYIPTLWGAGLFSLASLFWSTVGSLAGIWLAFRISQSM